MSFSLHPSQSTFLVAGQPIATAAPSGRHRKDHKIMRSFRADAVALAATDVKTHPALRAHLISVGSVAGAKLNG